VDNELSNKILEGYQMKKTRRRYDRDFKISIVVELDGGKPPAQIAREHGIHPRTSYSLDRRVG
jgi:transposase-like protein